MGSSRAMLNARATAVGRVSGRLQVALRLPPGAAVDHERRHAHEREQADDDQHDRLSGVAAEPMQKRAHSRRSVALDVIEPS